MSKAANNPDAARPDEPQELHSDSGLESEDKGPNLILLYSLLALGLLAAMAFAALIVWPFYARR